MSETSRRRFIGVAGAGAAAAGATALVPGAASAAETRLHGRSATATVVALVEPHSDRVTLMVGEREVVVRDKDLVHRLLNAAGE
jgi:hypothetical protein